MRGILDAGISHGVVIMKANLLKSMVGIVLLGAACAANASTFTLPGSPLSPGDSGTFSALPGPGSFADNWDFTLTGPAGLGAAVISVESPTTRDITGLNLALYAGSTPVGVPLATGSSINLLSISGGPYDLYVTGDATGTKGGYYVGGVTTSPVPLPAAAWLLLSGLAGVGAMARRRRAA
jgi:hypothetical protein